MALLQMNLMSRALMRTVPVNVILPADKLVPAGSSPRGDKPYQTLYLLHGIFGSYTDWVCGTRLQRYAEDKDLAVVMPSGDNSFYVDRPEEGNNYGQFVGQELVELTRKIFPLSHAREDTFLGGLSMGGYGAMRNGLRYSDTFGYIVSLSGALHLEEIAARTKKSGSLLESRSYAQACFGDLTKLLGSDKDPKALIRMRKEDSKPIPKIYMACGLSDSLLEANRAMAAYLQEQGVSVTYEEGPGGHDWDFWDAYIKKAIDWLPTQGSGPGMSSGHILD